MKRLRAALPLLLLVATGIALFASGALDNLTPSQLADTHGQLRAGIAQFPWLARLGYIGLLALVVATGIPVSVVVTVAAGVLFGMTEATLWSTVGVTLGSLLLFAATQLALGRRRGHAPALVERLRHGYEHHPVNYTLFLRLAPGLPWGGVTIALAWLRCPLKLFVVATGTGALVMSVIEAAIGAGIADSLEQGQQHVDLGTMLMSPHILLPLLALALLALLPLLLGRLRHAGRPADKPPHP